MKKILCRTKITNERLQMFARKSGEYKVTYMLLINYSGGTAEIFHHKI